jgi:hypothetical protein
MYMNMNDPILALYDQFDQDVNDILKSMWSFLTKRKFLVLVLRFLATGMIAYLILHR